MKREARIVNVKHDTELITTIRYDLVMRHCFFEVANALLRFM